MTRTRLLAAALAMLAFGLGAHSSQAATVAILGGDQYDNFGGSLGVSFPGYGSSVEKNNVVNSGYSVVYDPTGGAAWLLNATVYSTITPYTVTWWYVGSESGDQTRFFAPTVSPTAGYTEPVGFGDKNNSYNAATATGAIAAGSFSGMAALVDFAAGDLTTGNVVKNGANAIPDTGKPSLIFAYVDPTTLVFAGGLPTYAELSTKPSDWFVFGYNDNGGGDDNHDDIVGIARISCPDELGCANTEVPLPAAAWLFGSALAGMGLLGMRRRRRSNPAA